MKPKRVAYNAGLESQSSVGKKLFENYQRFRDPTREIRLGGDQAEDQITIGREVVEVAWMNIHALCGEKLDRQILVGTRCRDAQDGVPAAFHRQARASFLPRQLSIEFRKISTNARHQLLLKRVPLFEKRRHRQLHWRVHRAT